MVETATTRLDEMFLQVCITSRCNLTCAHCYVEDGARDMGSDLFSRVIGQFDDLVGKLQPRRVWVQVSGGEPLTHPDIERLLAISVDKFPTKVLTNGVFVDDNIAGILARHCESVQVSIDGNAAAHDARRGAGSYEAAVAGLRVLKKHGLPVGARISVGDDNLQEVEPLFENIKDEIDAYFVSRVVPIGGCDIGMPDTGEYRKIIYRLFAMHQHDRKISLRDPFFGPLLSINCGEDFCGCSAGINGLCVDVNGDIYPCRRLPICVGNTARVSLADVYFTDPVILSLRARLLGGSCANCENKANCGGSRCAAYAATGDAFAADPGCIFAG